MSLTEILIVVSVMAILMTVSIPAVRQLMNSFESTTGVRQLINAALANARAIAIREQTYAGVRFQQGTDGSTYIIFITQDSDVSQWVTNPALKGLLNAYGFRAVMGRKPMKLPEGVSISGVTALTGPSVIFSKSGKLTVHPVYTWNKDGFDDGDDSSKDTIFNTPLNVSNGSAMFAQDSGFGIAMSLQAFDLRVMDKDGSIVEYTTEYISPYTGELVMEYRE